MFAFPLNSTQEVIKEELPTQYSGSIKEEPKHAEEEIRDTGEYTLNGFRYAFSPNGSTINGVAVNNLKLALKRDGKLYYFDNGGWKPYDKSLMQTSVESTVAKKDDIPVAKPPISVPPTQPIIEQIQQIVPVDRPISTEQLTMEKFNDKKTLFEQPASLLLLVGIGVGVFYLINNEKK